MIFPISKYLKSKRRWHTWKHLFNLWVLPLEPNTVLTSNTWGLEAAFPLRKTFAAVARNLYQARGGFCALQLHSIKYFPGGLGWHGSVGPWDTWACRARAASAMSRALPAPSRKERGMEQAQVSGARPPLLAAPSWRCSTGWATKGPRGQPSAVVRGREARLPADAPGGSCRLTSVTSSVYRRANRCLQRESLNFDIQHKDVNTSPQKINPEH